MSQKLQQYLSIYRVSLLRPHFFCDLVLIIHKSFSILTCQKHVAAAYSRLLLSMSPNVKEQLDGSIVLNEHNTVFASKRSAICAQAVHFLHSMMPSVTCLRLSGVSVMCRVTYF